MQIEIRCGACNENFANEKIFSTHYAQKIEEKEDEDLRSQKEEEGAEGDVSDL